MIFGKYINRYYLRSAPVLLLGLLALLTVDYIQLMIPELYRLVINGVNLGEVVIDGQTPFADPAQGFRQSALQHPHPRPQRRDGRDVRNGRPEVAPLRLGQQDERAVQISLGLAQPGPAAMEAIRPIGQPELLAQGLAFLQMAFRGLQVTLFAAKRSQAQIHIADPRKHGTAFVESELQ